MPFLTVERFLQMLPLDAVTERLGGPVTRIGLEDLEHAFARCDSFANGILEALRSTYADEMADSWTEIEEALAMDLRPSGLPMDTGWGPLIHSTDVILHVAGPPGARIEYATEYHLLELRDDASGGALYVVFLFDERGWEGAPEIIDVQRSLEAVNASVATILTEDYGTYMRDYDPSITFRTSIPEPVLWPALDQVIGSSFGDWVEAFRRTVGGRSWLKRDVIVTRTAHRLRIKDEEPVRTMTDQILSGDLQVGEDRLPDAFDLVRAAYWACWEI